MKNYFGVDEDNAAVIVKLTDQEIVTEVKDMNKQDDEEQTEAAGTEMTEITMLQAQQQAIDCLKSYIIKSDGPEDVNEESIAAAVKVNKHLIMTRNQKSTQKKLRTVSYE